ncbi:hypothetical protein PLICRDRAFT_146352 [Plicaturopsis crispa FD-325 SS-3]|uniref:Uncharacterized protein n=1 Tax=Plicaturopsis crispa FD-325 SS-3 TaxID=944288 RepID=A0A0C9T665_PLICR|nr:hypothetical protein PLICRDRAFT_146352 [Plicaturopsis crispa FD-325 SS-3]
MASDSSSSTPMSLTPESTGTPDAAAKKARRQTAFYPNMNAANKPQKPFSRSAAKRESVMALGSIEHLQHYFTKTGLARKDNPLNSKHKGLVPAIGGLNRIKTNASLSGIPAFQLPPSPAIPSINRPAFPQVERTYETDPESLLPGVVADLTAVAHAWALDRDLSSSEQPQHDPQKLGVVDPNAVPGKANHFDVLGTLKTTTHAVRSVRNYVVSLPDESAGTIRSQYRHKSLSAIPAPKRLPKRADSTADPLTLIRRSALEVLTVLRELEESSRLPLSDDAYDAQSDHGSSQDQGSHSRVASPSGMSDEPGHDHDSHGQELEHVHHDSSVAFSLVQVKGRYESVPVWEEEEEDDNISDEEREKREHWDERLVLGSGWLYKQDIRLEDLGKEQDVVRQYIDVVDDVLFGGVKAGQRGWDRENERVAKKVKAEKEKEGRASRRRVSAGDGDGQRAQFDSGRSGRRVVSTGMLDAMSNVTLSEEPEEMEMVSEADEDEEDIDDDELPAWARRSTFADDVLGRAHAMLTNLLPVDLLPALPPSSDRAVFLQGLSSGQLLCAAYNTGVRRSRRPWGYISKDAIHDIIALEQAQSAMGVNRDTDEKGRTGWTFRRTDNLRLWAAALKLRYMLPIYAPPGTSRLGTGTPSGGNTPLASPSPSMQRFPSTEPPIYFDAPSIAKREEGWEDMLQGAIVKWMNAVIDERRRDR